MACVDNVTGCLGLVVGMRNAAFLRLVECVQICEVRISLCMTSSSYTFDRACAGIARLYLGCNLLGIACLVVFVPQSFNIFPAHDPFPFIRLIRLFAAFSAFFNAPRSS